jgi:hypothetical protein
MLGLIPLPDVLTLVGDLYTKLGGEDGASWFAELKRFLRKEPTWATAQVEPTLAPVVLKSWRTIRLGVYKTAEAYIAALEAKGFKIGTYARQILAKISIAQQEEDLELFLGSARDFGCTYSTARQKLFDRAALHGYYPCPAETGPAARLGYEDQPKGEYRVVAMEPITDSGDYLRLFVFKHDGHEVWLGTNYGRPDSEWDPDDVWVWCRRKP